MTAFRDLFIEYKFDMLTMQEQHASRLHWQYYVIEIGSYWRWKILHYTFNPTVSAVAHLCEDQSGGRESCSCRFIDRTDVIQTTVPTTYCSAFFLLLGI